MNKSAITWGIIGVFCFTIIIFLFNINNSNGDGKEYIHASGLPKPTATILPTTNVTPTPTSQQTHIPTTTPNTDVYIDLTPKTFTSEKGHFSIELPTSMTMTENVEFESNGYTVGEVNFTFYAFDSNSFNGLVVSYGKPEIVGKGGACGGYGFVNETIALQVVEVCETSGGFSAAYFKNPSREIEYSTRTGNVTEEQVTIIKKAIRETLKFE